MTGLLVLVLGIVLSTTSCIQRSSAHGDELNIIATTSIVGDVVSQVGGEKIFVDVLLPLGSDPHSYYPTPRDASGIADASIIFANGAGLEEFLNPLLASVGGKAKVVEVSAGIDFLSIVDEDSRSDQLVDDPHTWMDPNNIIIWVDNILRALSESDPQNSDYYRDNARSYQERLRELDTWITSQVARVPEQNRKIVTDHLIFGYFADQYGFSQVGAIIPGFSSLAEPSAKDLVQIQDDIHRLGVKAIFLNVGANVNLAQRISDDTGTTLVFLYMHSLSEQGGEAENYIDFMHYDINKIIEALR